MNIKPSRPTDQASPGGSHLEGGFVEILDLGYVQVGSPSINGFVMNMIQEMVKEEDCVLVWRKSLVMNDEVMHSILLWLESDHNDIRHCYSVVWGKTLRRMDQVPVNRQAADYDANCDT